MATSICPFCGGLIEYQQYKDDHFFTCDNCGTQIMIKSLTPGSVMFGWLENSREFRATQGPPAGLRSKADLDGG